MIGNVSFGIYVKILILFLFFMSCSKQGNTVADKDPETVKVDSLLSLYAKNEPQDLNNTKECILNAQKDVKDSLNYYKLTSLFASYYYLQNKMDSAILMTKAVIAFCGKHENKKSVAELLSNAYNNAGVFYQILAQRDSAIYYLKQSVAIFNQMPDKRKLIDVYINLADNFKQEGKYIPAIDYYRKAMLLSDSLNLHEKYASPINLGFGQIYTELRNFPMADDYYKKVEAGFDSLPVYEQFHFANTKGNFYYTAKEYEKSLPWLYKAKSIAARYDQSVYEAITDGNLGEIYLLLHRNDSAKYYLDKAAKVFLTPGASPAAAFYINGLYASLYLQANQTGKAERLLSTPYDTLSVDASYLYFHNKRLEEMYRQKGDYKNAYLYADLATALDDSLRNITVRNNIEEINFRYSQDTTLLRKDILINQNEQKVLRLNFTLITLVALFIILILAITVIIFYLKRKRELEYAKQIELITRLRMENVRNRISPHFMFNVLNSLMPDLKEHPGLNKPVDYLIESIRGNLSASEQIAVELEEEIRNVKNYLNLLHSLRWELPKIDWNIDKGIDLQTKILSMCLQIPVENAIKYAFDERTGNNLLQIHIFNKDNCLLIKIEDNGIGFDPANQTHSAKGTGNGLKILYKTIEILNLKNSNKIEFDIRNKASLLPVQKGTIVTLKIPLNYKYEL